MVQLFHMRMIDLIEKKKAGEALTREELYYWINGLVNDEIPMYQSSALLMAIMFKGMGDHEIYDLTSAMYHSGDIVDLSKIEGVKVDKHSTGGVGDKTSLVLLPMVASCGVKVAKMSGRGLGHTGGTLDKLESIPNTKVSVNEKDFIDQVNRIGIALVGQSQTLAPADKKLYGLRDVTGTVNSIPLIASSIMSKKLATSCDTLLLDVTIGSGAFIKDFDSALELANLMIRIGEYHHLPTRAIISNMDEPLGNAIGNALEVKEAIAALKGEGPADLMELCYQAGSIMLMQAKVCNTELEARKKLEEVIKNGTAYNKFVEMIKAQGGDVSYIEDTSKFNLTKYSFRIVAPVDGYVSRLDAYALGKAAMRLGAGREKISDYIDFDAGIYLHHKVGDKVSRGDKILSIYTNRDDYEDIFEEINKAVSFSSKFVEKPTLIFKVL